MFYQQSSKNSINHGHFYLIQTKTANVKQPPHDNELVTQGKAKADATELKRNTVLLF